MRRALVAVLAVCGAGGCSGLAGERLEAELRGAREELAGVRAECRTASEAMQRAARDIARLRAAAEAMAGPLPGVPPE